MTADKNPTPYRAKGQEAADAVAAVMQHAAARDEAAGKKKAVKKPAKWALPLGINLFVFALYLLIAPPPWVELDPFEEPPAEKQVEDMGTAMYFQIARIDAYRAANGALPVSLADAGSPIDGIEYTVLDPNRYQLTATVAGETVTFDSSQPETAASLMSNEAVLKIQSGG